MQTKVFNIHNVADPVPPVLDPGAIPSLRSPAPAPSFETIVAVGTQVKRPSIRVRVLDAIVVAATCLALLTGVGSFINLGTAAAAAPIASIGFTLLHLSWNPAALATCLALLTGVGLLGALRGRIGRSSADVSHRLVVGPRREVRRFLGKHDDDGATVVAPPGPASVSAQGEAFSLPGIVLSRPVDEVVLLRGWRSRERCEAALRDCNSLGVDVAIELEEQADALPRRARVTREGSRWFARYTSVPRADARQRAKLALEYAVAVLLTVMALPLMALIAAAIKCTSPGPVLFRQLRTGLGGRRIPCFKFRTMVDGAHAAQGRLAERNEMRGSLLFKMNDDPRVTTVGRFLRRTSLDELPQLFNVLRGELTLIGPRLLSIPLERYRPEHRRRLSVRPGIACTWQAWHRGETDFEAWMRSDLDYLDRWSPGLDFRILLRTGWVVLRREGAR